MDWTQQLSQHLHGWYEANKHEHEACCNVYRVAMLDFERTVVEFALNVTGGNLTHSARLLGLSIGKLRDIARRHRIDFDAYRQRGALGSGPSEEDTP